jgi:hypothetical protein
VPSGGTIAASEIAHSVTINVVNGLARCMMLVPGVKSRPFAPAAFHADIGYARECAKKPYVVVRRIGSRLMTTKATSDVSALSTVFTPRFENATDLMIDDPTAAM